MLWFIRNSKHGSKDGWLSTRGSGRIVWGEFSDAWGYDTHEEALQVVIALFGAKAALVGGEARVVPQPDSAELWEMYGEAEYARQGGQ